MNFSPTDIEQVEMQVEPLRAQFHITLNTERADLELVIDGQPIYLNNYMEFVLFIRGFKTALILAKEKQ